MQVEDGDETEAQTPEDGLQMSADREHVLKRLDAFRGLLPANFKFDRDEANAR